MLDVLMSRKRLRRGTRAFRREVDVGDARVFVDHGFQWDGARNVWLTRARASFVLGAGPQFRLRPRGFLERAVGLRRGRPSGDACIDDFFVAHTDDAEGTWGALTTRARSILARTFEDAELISDGHMVTLFREADFGREADAAEAAELVAEVVNYRSREFSRLRALPGAFYRHASGDWESRKTPSILLHLPSAVVLQPIGAARGAALAVTAACGGNTPRVLIDCDDPASVVEGCQRIGIGLAAIGQLGLRWLVCDGEGVSLSWRTLEVSRDRILAGSRLVTELADNGQRALYR